MSPLKLGYHTAIGLSGQEWCGFEIRIGHAELGGREKISRTEKGLKLTAPLSRLVSILIRDYFLLLEKSSMKNFPGFESNQGASTHTCEEY